MVQIQVAIANPVLQDFTIMVLFYVAILVRNTYHQEQVTHLVSPSPEPALAVNIFLAHVYVKVMTAIVVVISVRRILFVVPVSASILVLHVLMVLYHQVLSMPLDVFKVRCHVRPCQLVHLPQYVIQGHQWYQE